MVDNGTVCRMNKIVWAPHFGLSTVRQTLRSLLTGYSQCDLDIGEMFINFLLNDTMEEMSGVDVQHVHSKSGADAVWEGERLEDFKRWCRSWMRLRDSRYRSIQLLI